MSKVHHANLFYVLTHTLDPWGEVKCQIIFFSESSHVAYQINENRAYSTMQAHRLSLHLPSAPGKGSKVQNIFFTESSHFAYQTKLYDYIALCKHILCPFIHPQTPDGIKRPKHFF